MIPVRAAVGANSSSATGGWRSAFALRHPPGSRPSPTSTDEKIGRLQDVFSCASPYALNNDSWTFVRNDREGWPYGDDPLFMQIKEASASVLEPYAGVSPYKNHGERVVIGQRMMQAASDPFLGWTSFNGRDYYARQLRDMRLSAEGEAMEP